MSRSRAWACRPFVRGLVFVVLTLAASPAWSDDELEYGLEERRLRQLEFEGVEFFGTDRLRDLLGLIDAPWYQPFGDPRYLRERVEQGVEAIRGLYRREGFHAARVRLQEVSRRD